MSLQANLAILVAACAGAVGAAALAAQPSPLPPPPARGTALPSGQCILSRDIRNHSIADRHTLLFDVNNEIYRVTVSNNCLAAATSSDPLVLRHPGVSYICNPIDLDVAVSKGGAPSRCIIDSIVKLTPEQAAALPKKLKP
jgi:hypothetical protein